MKIINKNYSTLDYMKETQVLRLPFAYETNSMFTDALASFGTLWVPKFVDIFKREFTSAITRFDF